jgi:hypothetical protein
VVDPSMFSTNGGPSNAERMHRAGLEGLRRGDNRRVGQLGAMGGWDPIAAIVTMAGSVCFRYKGVKAAAFTDVRELYPGHIVGHRTGFCRDADNLIRRHEQEIGLIVDEPSNQPRARNSVDDRTFSGDPLHDVDS